MNDNKSLNNKNLIINITIAILAIGCLITAIIFYIQAQTKTCEIQIYTIENQYFSESTYEKNTFDINNHNHTITINTKCSVPLFAYSIEIKIFSHQNELLYNKTIYQTLSSNANELLTYTLHIPFDTYFHTNTVEINYVGFSYEQPTIKLNNSAPENTINDYFGTAPYANKNFHNTLPFGFFFSLFVILTIAFFLHFFKQPILSFLHKEKNIEIKKLIYDNQQFTIHRAKRNGATGRKPKTPY